jgi:hypothetical protein
MPTFRQLDARAITRTLEETCERIRERFPESNLNTPAEMTLSAVLQTIEAGINDVVFFGLAGVNEIETLATGLSGKIWQKITILERSGSRAN